MPPPRKAPCLNLSKHFLGTIPCGSIKKKLFKSEKQHFEWVSAGATCFESKCKAAFTLAEVLITLGIIGVAASLTIPSLIQSYKKQVVETRLAKFYSMMNQAVRMAEIDYGPQDTWSDYHENDNEKDENGNPLFDKGEKYDAHINKYFAPYLKIIGSEETEKISSGPSPQKVYYLADGSAFSFNLHENREIYFYPFGNPKKCISKQVRGGSCLFAFAFIPYVSWEISGYKYNISNGLQPSLYKWDGNEDKLMSDTTYGCNKKGHGTYCTEIIRRNGWKIPKDYPRKF